MPMLKETMLKRLLLPLSAAGGGGSAPVQDTATGNPLVFFTDLARPLKSLLIPFTPRQSGTGDPSPENIRSILPWNGLMVFGGGKNLLGAEIEQGTIAGQTGLDSTSTQRVRTKGVISLPAGTYTISAVGVGQANVFLYNSDGVYLNPTGFSNLPKTITIENAYLVRIVFRKSTNNEDITPSDISNIQLEVGQTATTYEAPHITDTDIVFPSPVYGGTLDVVSGVLTVEYIAHTFTANDALYQYGEYTGGIRINTNVLDNTKVGGSSAICNIAKKLNSVPATIDSLSYRISGGTSRTAFFIPDSMFDGGATVDKFKEWLSENEFTICAELETQQTVTLTPAQITALVGDNTIWSDADGSMTAVYLKKA